MKSSELRIGNLTNAGVVNEILTDCFYVNDGEGSLKSTWFEIEPIPLTKEWLLKFGFESREESTNFNYFGFGENPVTHDWMLCLKHFKDENRFFFLNGFHTIKYIHQLQNLYFALTNEELTLIK